MIDQKSMHTLFDPSVDRATKIDQQLRDKLIGSLEYLAGYLTSATWDRSNTLAQALVELKTKPVSPWVFGIYAILVQNASHEEPDVARQNFDSLIAAITTPPPSKTMITMADIGLSDTHRTVAQTLFDTDPARPFLPQPPTSQEFDACCLEIKSALALIKNADPDLAAEMNVLVRLFLLAVPEGLQPSQGFNGASTFFLWGATLINARPERGIIGMVDLLIHEASHLLLFGLVSGGPLSKNDPNKLYNSPLRTDLRPIDGIFHAAFVSTRVHLSMQRMRNGGMVPADLLTALDKSAKTKKAAALSAVDLLHNELDATPEGQEIFDAMVNYWQADEDSAAECVR